MLIDWFTVGAQSLNFLILVWLMKRFLYKPILNAIDAREKRIAKELADADTKKAEAQKDRDEFAHKNEEFDQQRATLLKKATDEAQAERQRLLNEARQASDALNAKRMETMRSDANNLNQAIRRRTEQEVFAIVRKALTDLATTSLEERLGEVFTRRLRELNADAKARLGNALKTMSAPALVRSAFDLPAEQRAAIQNALNETFSAEIHVRFEIAPELISGIELTANGQKAAWSIADYLTSMQEGVDELLNARDESEAKANTPNASKQKIATRAYELYEQRDHKGSSASQDWSQAEREIRNDETNAKPKPEPVVTVKPEAKAELKPAAKVTSAAKADAEPETKARPKANVEPEAKTEAKANAKIEPKSKSETKPAVPEEAK